MSWLNATLEVSSNAIEVNTEGLGLRGEDGKEVKTLMAKPLSAHEYQVLKNDPELRTLVGADKTELLGLKMTFEMLKKCDSSLKWQQFRQLPLSLIAEIAQRVSTAVGSPTEDGGGVLGEV